MISRWIIIQNLVIFTVLLCNNLLNATNYTRNASDCQANDFKACYNPPFGREGTPPLNLPYTSYGVFPYISCQSPTDRSSRWRVPIFWEPCQDNRRIDLIPTDRLDEWSIQCAKIPVPSRYELDGSYHLEVFPLELEFRRLTRWKDYRKHSTFNPFATTFKDKGSRRNLAINQTAFDDRIRIKSRKDIIINLSNKLNIAIPMSNNHPYTEFSNDIYQLIDNSNKLNANISFNRTWYRTPEPIITQRFLDVNNPFQEYYPELYFVQRHSLDPNITFNFKLKTCDEIDDLLNPLDPYLEKIKDTLLQRPMTDPNYMADMSYSPAECYHTELASDSEVEYAIRILHEHGIDKIYDAVFETTPRQNISSYYIQYHKVPRWEEDIPKTYDPSKEYFNTNKKATVLNDNLGKLKVLLEKDIWDPDHFQPNPKKHIQKQPIGVKWNLLRDSKKDFLMFRNGKFYKRRFVPCPRLHLWMLEGGIGELYINKKLLSKYSDSIQEPFHIFIPEFRGEALLRSRNFPKNIDITKETIKQVFGDEINMARLITMDFASLDVLFLIDRMHHLYPRPDSLNYIHSASYASLWAQRIAAINSSSINGLVLDSPLSPTFNANEEPTIAELGTLNNLLELCGEDEICRTKFKNRESDLGNYFHDIVDSSNECHSFINKSLGKDIEIHRWWQEGLTSYFINMGVGHLFLRNETVPVDFRVLALALLYQAGRCKAPTFFKRLFLLLFPYLHSSLQVNENERLHRPIKRDYSHPPSPSCPIIHQYMLFKEYWNTKLSKDDVIKRSKSKVSINMTNIEYQYQLYELYKEYFVIAYDQESFDHMTPIDGKMMADPPGNGIANNHVISAHTPRCPLPGMTMQHTESDPPYLGRKMMDLETDDQDIAMVNRISTEPLFSCTCCCPAVSDYSKPLASWSYYPNYTEFHDSGDHSSFYERPHIYKYEQNNQYESIFETWNRTGWFLNTKTKLKSFPHKLNPFSRQYVKNRDISILMLHGSMNARMPKSEATNIYIHSKVGKFYYYNFWRCGHNVLESSQSCTDSILQSFFNFTRLPWNPMNVFPMNASWPFPYHINNNNSDLISKILVCEIALYSNNTRLIRDALNKSDIPDDILKNHLKRYLLYDGLSSKSRDSFGSPEYLLKDKIQWSQTISIENILDYIRVMADDNSLFQNYPHYSFSWNYYMAWRNVAYRGLNIITDIFGRKRIYFSFGGDRFIKFDNSIYTMTSPLGKQLDGIPRAPRCSCHIVGPDEWLPKDSVQLTPNGDLEDYWVSLIDNGKYINKHESYYNEFIKPRFNIFKDDPECRLVAFSEFWHRTGQSGNYSICCKYNKSKRRIKYSSRLAAAKIVSRPLVQVEKEYISVFHHLKHDPAKNPNYIPAFPSLSNLEDPPESDSFYTWNSSIYGLIEDEDLILAPSSSTRLYVTRMLHGKSKFSVTPRKEFFPEHILPMESRLFSPESISFPGSQQSNLIRAFLLGNHLELHKTAKSHVFTTGEVDQEMDTDKRFSFSYTSLSMSPNRVITAQVNRINDTINNVPDLIVGHSYESKIGAFDIHELSDFDFCTCRFIFNGTCHNTALMYNFMVHNKHFGRVDLVSGSDLSDYESLLTETSDGRKCNLNGWLNDVPMYLLTLDQALSDIPPFMAKVFHQGLAFGLNEPNTTRYILMEHTWKEFKRFSKPRVSRSFLSTWSLPRSNLDFKISKVIFRGNLTHVTGCDVIDDDDWVYLYDCEDIDIRLPVSKRITSVHFKYVYEPNSTNQIRKYYAWVAKDVSYSGYLKLQTNEEEPLGPRSLDRDQFSWSWPIYYKTFVDELDNTANRLIDLEQLPIYRLKVLMDTEGTLNSLLEPDYFYIDSEIHIPKPYNGSLSLAWIGNYFLQFTQSKYFEMTAIGGSEPKSPYESFRRKLHVQKRNPLLQSCTKCKTYFPYDDKLALTLDMNYENSTNGTGKETSLPRLELFTSMCSIMKRFDMLQERLQDPCCCVEQLNLGNFLDWRQNELAMLLDAETVFDEPLEPEVIGMVVGIMLAVICAILLAFFFFKYLRYSLNKKDKTSDNTRDMMAKAKSIHKRQIPSMSSKYRRTNQIYPEGYGSSILNASELDRNSITFERSQRRSQPRKRSGRRISQPFEQHPVFTGLDLSYKFGEDDTTSVSSYIAPSFDLRRAPEIGQLESRGNIQVSSDGIYPLSNDNAEAREAFRMMARRRASAPALPRKVSDRKRSQTTPMEVDWFDTDEEASLIHASDDDSEKIDIDLERGHTAKKQDKFIITEKIINPEIQKQEPAPVIQDDSVMKRTSVRSIIGPRNYKSRYIPNDPSTPIFPLKKEKEQ